MILNTTQGRSKVARMKKKKDKIVSLKTRNDSRNFGN